MGRIVYAGPLKRLRAELRAELKRVRVQLKAELQAELRAELNRRLRRDALDDDRDLREPTGSKRQPVSNDEMAPTVEPRSSVDRKRFNDSPFFDAEGVKERLRDDSKEYSLVVPTLLGPSSSAELVKSFNDTASRILTFTEAVEEKIFRHERNEFFFYDDMIPTSLGPKTSVELRLDAAFAEAEAVKESLRDGTDEWWGRRLSRNLSGPKFALGPRLDTAFADATAVKEVLRKENEGHVFDEGSDVEGLWGAEAMYNEISLERTLWDAALFVGSPLVGTVGSFLLGALLAINVALQVAMITILYFADLITPAIGSAEVEQLRSWRTLVAHDFAHFDPISQRTLAARVCAEDFGLNVGASQVNTYMELRSYLGDYDGQGAVGPALCFVALSVWSLRIVREMASVVNVLNAVRHLEWSRYSDLLLTDEGTVVIRRLSWWRGLWMASVQLGRLLICFTLAWYGSLFLVYTSSVTELLLNTLALEFIFMIDELMFTGLAPGLVKFLVDTTLPLRVPQGRGMLGLDLRSAVAVVIVVVFVASITLGKVLPQIAMLVSARDALCAGDLDFVYTNDGIGVSFWAYPDGVDKKKLNSRNYPDGKSVSMTRGSVTVPRRSFSEGLLDVLLRQQARAEIMDECTIDKCFDINVNPAEKLADGETNIAGNVAAMQTNIKAEDRPDCCFVQRLQVPAMDGGKFSIKRKSTESIIEGTQVWNPSCRDAMDSGQVYEVLLKGAVGDAVNSVFRESCPASGKCPAETPMCYNNTCVVPTCKGVSQHCHSENIAGVRVRQMCPQTCGCDNPRAGLLLSRPENGCGLQCLKSGAYLARRRALPCEDDDAALREVLVDWDQVRQTWPLDWRDSSIMWIGYMMKHGCSFLGNKTVMQQAQAEFREAGFPALPAYFAGLNLCTDTGNAYPIKPLANYCPVACGCHRGMEHCPDACPARAPFSQGDLHSCPAHQRGQFATFLGDPIEGQQEVCPMAMTFATAA